MNRKAVELKSQLCSLETKAGRLEFVLRRSRRRSVEIAIRPDQAVRVSAPRQLPIREIERFVLQKADWIANKLIELRRESLHKRTYETGQIFLFMGKEYPLNVIAGQNGKGRLTLTENELEISLPADIKDEERSKAVKELMVKWYRAEAEELFGARLFQLARQLGQEPRAVAVRTQKRMWGNCHTHDKRIHLNWLLILAPIAVIDYVIVHELCHLIVPNHSYTFWRKVEEFMPDYKERRRWLKINERRMALPEVGC